MTGGKWGWNGQLVVVFVILLAMAGPTVLGANGANSSLASDSVESVTNADAAQREPPDENNTSVVHRNPDEVSEDESLSDTEIWLSREMAGRLSESANLSQQDRERAQELIDNNSEYAELAEQYQEVQNQQQVEETESSPLQAGQRQREFFAEVELYRQIHEEYREARENDQELRTRRLAHELERRSTAVNRSADRLNKSYANISSWEDAELRNATQTIGKIRSNITQTQQTVRNQTLVRTQLSVRTDEPGGSFTDPIPLVGHLQVVDGEPVADENVTLQVGNRTLNTTTNENGRFEVGYRPTLAGTGERPRTVEFWPANESVYLQDNATVEFDVRQIEPNVTISNRTATIRYNNTLAVNGTVTADSIGIPDMPLSVTVDGIEIARVRTAEDGSFGIADRLPANVSAGDQQIDVNLSLENATARADGPVALAPTNESAELSVEETQTSLSIADVQTFNETAFVTGRLTTESGDSLANLTIELRVDGTTIGEATTNATGGYGTTVPIPQRLLGNDSTIEVMAIYSPPDGNLASAQANVTTTVDSSGTMMIPDDQLRLGVAGLIGIAVLSAFIWRTRWDNQSALADSPEPETTSNTTDSTVERDQSAKPLLDAAAEHLRDKRGDVAVVFAYEAIRQSLDNTVERETGKTHWEFYDACSNTDLSAERLSELKHLTESYERAAFSAESTSVDAAAEAIRLARALRDSVASDGAARGHD